MASLRPETALQASDFAIFGHFQSQNNLFSPNFSKAMKLKEMSGNLKLRNAHVAENFGPKKSAKKSHFTFGGYNKRPKKHKNHRKENFDLFLDPPQSVRTPSPPPPAGGGCRPSDPGSGATPPLLLTMHCHGSACPVAVGGRAGKKSPERIPKP